MVTVTFEKLPVASVLAVTLIAVLSRKKDSAELRANPVPETVIEEPTAPVLADNVISDIIVKLTPGDTPAESLAVIVWLPPEI